MNISIDANAKTYKFNKGFKFGIGNDHAATLTRKDVYEYLKFVQKEIGFKYLRFHGIFDDDMHIYQRLSDFPLFNKMPEADKIKEINFKQVGVVLDNVLEAGFKPYIELSFMPSALASKKAYGFHYKNNISKPKSYHKWAEFITLFINYLIARYTLEEVKTWLFEVWNEPDLKAIFFRGSQADYFKLYSVTAKAIKKVNKELKVGGPVTSGCLWLEDFISYCKSNNVPYDFISTHHYPGDGFGNNFGPERFAEMKEKIVGLAKAGADISETMTSLFFHPEEYKNYPLGILTKKDKEARALVGNIPLYITEWNSTSVYGAPIHDEKMSACFIVKTMLDSSGICNGYMFWCLSDYFEEQFLINKPFHGGFGILTNNGIPKPNFYAFKILNSLYENRLETPKTKGIEYAAFIKDNRIQILIYNYDNDYYKHEEEDISITINKQISEASVSYINDKYTNPKALWQRLGSKNNLSKEEVSYIKNNSKPEKMALDYIYAKNFTKIKLRISTNDVILIEVKW